MKQLLFNYIYSESIHGGVSDDAHHVMGALHDPANCHGGSVRSKIISTPMCNSNMIKLLYKFIIKESNKTLNQSL